MIKKTIFEKFDYDVYEIVLTNDKVLEFKPKVNSKGITTVVIPHFLSKYVYYTLISVLLVKQGFTVYLPETLPHCNLTKISEKLKILLEKLQLRPNLIISFGFIPINLMSLCEKILCVYPIETIDINDVEKYVIDTYREFRSEVLDVEFPIETCVNKVLNYVKDFNLNDLLKWSSKLSIILIDDEVKIKLKSFVNKLNVVKIKVNSMLTLNFVLELLNVVRNIVNV